MGGPGSGRRRKPATAQPRGTRWLTARAACFQLYGDTCHICGHPGATEADHLVPTGDPALYLDPGNLRPAHGGRVPCPICGRKCNQSRGGARRIAAQARANGTQNGAGKNLSAPQPPPRPPGHQCDDPHCPYHLATASRCW